MIKILRKILRPLGFDVVHGGWLNHLQEQAQLGNWAQWGNGLHSMASELADSCVIQEAPLKYYSQGGQDFVAYLLFGRSGFFVEFGAADGIGGSNSLTLEKLGWSGILAEPSKRWHALLHSNRPKAIVSEECVWSESGAEIEFVETSNGYFDGAQQYSDVDEHDRIVLRRYSVPTVSLVDLLKKLGAPTFIEFISIDTEGSEFEILSAFDWDKYTFGFIAVEHNFTESREKIRALMIQNGYHEVLPSYSRHDDWYVHKSILKP